MWNLDLPDEEWVVRFLKAVGSDPDEFPPGFLAAAVPLVPVVRRDRPVYDGRPTPRRTRRGRFPKLVVSGGHNAGFDAIGDDLAQKIGAARALSRAPATRSNSPGSDQRGAPRRLWRP